MRYLIAVLALIVAGWMAFDGARALIIGDYVTPRSGPYAGKLGPWSEVVRVDRDRGRIRTGPTLGLVGDACGRRSGRCWVSSRLCYWRG